MLLETSKLGSAAGGEFNAFAWLVTFYSYFIFLYLDFSGYTDIVIGCAGLCGFSTLPENFNRPYLSRNVQEVLGALAHLPRHLVPRDYVFYAAVPPARRLGASWRSLFLTNIAALAVTFLLVGAWHGPGLNFVAFRHRSGCGRRRGGQRTCAAGAVPDARNPGEGREQPDPDRPVLAALLSTSICASFLLLENFSGRCRRASRGRCRRIWPPSPGSAVDAGPPGSLDRRASVRTRSR